MQLGAQLYTVREYTKDLDSFSETLKKIADIGYRTVQVSATCPFEAEWLRERLQETGLACAVTHTNPDRIADDTAAVADEHRVFGCKYVGIGCAPGGFAGGPPDYEAFARRFVPAAAALKARGLTLGYHNHHFEFARYGGQNLLERIHADFPAGGLTFILDTYWIQYSGGSPASWIRKLAGRVQCVHLKDMAVVGSEQRMAAVGEGNLEFGAILEACAQSGTEHLLVEQDNCYGEDPFSCLKRSFDNLKALGLD